MIKRAMLYIQEALDEQGLCRACGLVVSIHDELLLEVPEREVTAVSRIVRDGMENVFKLKVPFKVVLKVGRTWGDMKEVII